MPSLEDLPPEVLDHVLSFLRTKDLKKLCEVSKPLNSALTPKLYESIVFSTPSRSLDWTRAIEIPRDKLAHTKKVIVILPENDRFSDAWLDNQYDHNSDFWAAATPLLQYSVALHCHRIPKGQLLEFSWKVGTGIPRQLLGRGGCLLHRQNRLQTINLLTHSDNDSELLRPPPCLSTFRNVKQFRWNGSIRYHEIDEIRNFLAANEHQLQVLELGLTTWSNVNEHGQLDFARLHQDTFQKDTVFDLILEPLGVAPDNLFPNLRSLTLSLFSFSRISTKVLTTFRFDFIRSLKLSDCPGVFGLLENLVEAGITPRLTCFELVLLNPLEFLHNHKVEAICKFLQSFSSLRDLFMMITFHHTRACFPQIIHASTSHKQNLQRLIFHQRGCYDLLEPDPIRDLHFPWTQTYMGLADFPKLRYIGSSADIYSMARWLSLLRKKPSWRIIHFRTTCKLAIPEEESVHYTDDDEYRDELEAMIWDDFYFLTRSIKASIIAFNRYPHLCSVPSAFSFPEHLLFETDEAVQREDSISDSEEHSGEPNNEATSVLIKIKDFEDTIRWQIEYARLPKVSTKIYKFAQWAFGPSGLPSLDVLACGDFSTKGTGGFFLCRNGRVVDLGSRYIRKTSPLQLSFRLMHRLDSDFKTLVDEQMEFLSAGDAHRISGAPTEGTND